MEIVKTPEEVRKIVKAWKKEGLSVGFVPTMGFLHEGHKSLIDRAVKENDRVVVSVFVNPIQFGPNEDFEDYPRDINSDSLLCQNAGASLIFNPEPSDMYDSDFCTSVDMTGLTDNLCGAKRPGHFKGVCTVVSKLFNIAAPDRAYFGQKDAQQLAVIRRMVRDLNFDIEIIGCPIVRESDGLAKSSRNTYLSDNERQAALCLSRALVLGKTAIDKGERNSAKVIDIITAEISSEPLARVDYVKVVDALSMQDTDVIANDMLVAIAVYIGKTRLIDNFIYEI